MSQVERDPQATFEWQAVEEKWRLRWKEFIREPAFLAPPRSDPSGSGVTAAHPLPGTHLTTPEAAPAESSEDSSGSPLRPEHPQDASAPVFAPAGSLLANGPVAAGTSHAAAPGETATPSAAPESKRFYLLDMFPYPSLAGFSVNQLRGIAITDVCARFKEANGFEVLRPIGWDSFGLQIEHEANSNRLDPQEVVARGIERMREQLHVFGARIDWDREIRTSDPAFYRWTQWIFLKMLEQGLAAHEEMPMKWCPQCSVNLANEEVGEGRCIHCNHDVEERKIPQWILRITEYADRLHHGLRTLEWPPRVAALQRNWIGRRRGFKLTLKASSEFLYEYDEFCVFVRHIERIPGATFVVLAPEHPLVTKICDDFYREEVEAYIEKTRRMKERDRLTRHGPPDGQATGAFALNPVTLQPMPVWISSFVLPHFGFGAALGIPGHVEKHRAFADKHRLAIRTVYAERRAPTRNGTPPTNERTSVMINAGPLNGLPLDEARRRIHDMLKHTEALEPYIRFHIHDWVFARQRFWGEPIPVVHCAQCGIVPLPESALPVELPAHPPALRPDQGRSPLARLDSFRKTRCPRCEGEAERDTNTMPQWAGSCWYFLRYLSPSFTLGPFDTDQAKRWLPVDLCVGGIEHAILHLLYVRFYSYFLHDGGYVAEEEPFRKLLVQGRIYQHAPASSARRRAPHRGDRIDAAPYLEEFGADALRLHLLFLAPAEEDVVWSESGLPGCRRFLKRVYETIASRKETGKFVSRKVLVEKHRLIRRVTQAIESFHFNKAVSAFMAFIKVLRSAEVTPEEVDRATLRAFAILFAPFCPFIAAELWELLDGEGTVFAQRWPEFSPELLKPLEVEVAIMIDNRVRDRVVVEGGIAKNQLLDVVLKRPRVRQILGDRRADHVFVVPDRLVNFVFLPAHNVEGAAGALSHGSQPSP